MRHKSRQSYSLVEFMQRMILFSIPLVIINIVISIFSVINISQKNQETIDNSLSLYLRQATTKTSAIEHFMLWTVVEEPLVNSLETAAGPHALAEYMDTFRSRVNDNKYATGQEYQYFAYLKSQDMFFNASQMQLSYSDYIAIKDHITGLAASNPIPSNTFSWQTMVTPNGTYLYYLIYYRNFYFIALVAPQDLVAPLGVLNLGENGYLEVTDLNDQRLYISNPGAEPREKRSSSLLYSMQTYDGREHGLPFNIYLYSDNFSNYGTLLIVQILIMLTASVLCAIFAASIFIMYHRAVVPIKQFSDALAEPSPQNELINLEGSSIKELEQASVQFRNLIQEVKRLRIDIYEKELEKEQFEISFLQNQIRPHFYLNCLTTIGSMAQLEDYKSIESMVVFTSNYFRYLFQTDKDLVRLEYELAHIQAYLDIQALRYGPVFTYHCQIEKEDEQALILPLLLITFVENSLKHGMTGNAPLQLSLSVGRTRIADKPYLQIHIRDSGRGFPPHILKKIENRDHISEGLSTHIGITNSIQRLSLLYGTDYEIAFTNDSGGGAHVRIVIPLQIKEE